MKINRAELVRCLDRVYPAVGINVLVPKFQSFIFHGTHVQATDGAFWIVTPLPDGVNLNFSVSAEAFYNLLKKMSHETIELSVEEGEVLVCAPKVKSRFTIWRSEPWEFPNLKNPLSLDILDDLIQGLNFCRLGVSKDETLGPLCGVKVKSDTLWACDRHRILRWNLETSSGMDCSIPVKFLENLIKIRDNIVKMGFLSIKENGGGFLVVYLDDGSVIWGATLEGEYRDLEAFFPDEGQEETISLPSEFPDVIDRHITFLKDVPAVDKEVVFKITEDTCDTFSQKVTTGNRVDRDLSQSSSLESSRQGRDGFEFRINPLFLSDAMGVCWKFKYFPNSTVVLFETDKLSYLVQTRG